MRRHILPTGVALLVLTPGAFAQGPPPAKVVLDGVRAERVQQRRSVTGELRAVRRSILAAEEEGLVIQLDVDAGDSVRAGDVIARLDDELAQIELDRANAEVVTARAVVSERKANLERDERDVERIETAMNRGSVSPTELDRVRTAAASSEARLNEAESEVRRAEIDLRRAQKRVDDMVIVAPFDGRLVAKRTEVGQWVSRGDEIVELVELRRIEAWIDVPERFIGVMQSRLADATTPTTINVQVRALEEPVSGPVIAIVPDADPLSRLFPVRVLLENKGERLKPGMSATALVPTGEMRDAITIHKDAVLRDDAGSYVYFDAGGMAMPARIEVEFAFDDRLVIRPGQLQPGMNIVVRGNERMFPTQPLNIIGMLDGSPPPPPPANTGGPGGPGMGGPPSGAPDGDGTNNDARGGS